MLTSEKSFKAKNARKSLADHAMGQLAMLQTTYLAEGGGRQAFLYTPYYCHRSSNAADIA